MLCTFTAGTVADHRCDTVIRTLGKGWMESITVTVAGTFPNAGQDVLQTGIDKFVIDVVAALVGSYHAGIFQNRQML